MDMKNFTLVILSCLLSASILTGCISTPKATVDNENTVPSIMFTDSRLFPELKDYTFTDKDGNTHKITFIDDGDDWKPKSVLSYHTVLEIPTGSLNSHNEPEYTWLFNLYTYPTSAFEDSTALIFAPDFDVMTEKQAYTKDEFKPYLIYQGTDYLVYDTRVFSYPNMSDEEYIHEIYDKNSKYDEKQLLKIYTDIKKIISNTN